MPRDATTAPTPPDDARPPPSNPPRPDRLPPPAARPTDHPADHACPTAPPPPPVRCLPACTPTAPADTTGPAAHTPRPPSGSPARRSPSADHAPRTAPPAHPGPRPAPSADAPDGLPGCPVPGNSASMRRAPPRLRPVCGPPAPRSDRAASTRPRTPHPSGSTPRSADGALLRAAGRPCRSQRHRPPPSPATGAAGSPRTARPFPDRTATSHSPTSLRSGRCVRARPGRDRTLRCSSRRPGVRWSAHRVAAPALPCSATAARPGRSGCATGCAPASLALPPARTAGPGALGPPAPGPLPGPAVPTPSRRYRPPPSAPACSRRSRSAPPPRCACGSPPANLLPPPLAPTVGSAATTNPPAPS